MDTEHLKNAAAFLRQRIESGEYRNSHLCMVVDVLDGPCWDCEDNYSRKVRLEDKIYEFEKELKNRRKD